MVHLCDHAVWRLLAAIVRDEGAGEAELGVESQHVQAELIYWDVLSGQKSLSLLNLCCGGSETAQGRPQFEPAAIVTAKEECAVATVVQTRNDNRSANGRAELIPDKRSLRFARQVLKEVGGIERGIAME